jgi:hypothetical protein
LKFLSVSATPCSMSNPWSSGLHVDLLEQIAWSTVNVLRILAVEHIEKSAAQIPANNLPFSIDEECSILLQDIPRRIRRPRESINYLRIKEEPGGKF